jgi:SSS family solute:Na+ symporter
MTAGLHWIDGIIIAAYALGMIALGWYYSRRQRDTAEYFTGGGAMNPLLIGISLFATLLSTISYLSRPGEIIQNGPVILTGVLSIPIGYVVVAYLLIPTFMRYRLTSAYELLEKKLGLSTRLLGAAMFITLRLMWMAVLLNFASNATLVMLGWEGRWLFPLTLVIGSVALIYSSLGGLRAVVITDLAQFVLLLGGALFVVATVSYRMGGFSWFPTSWDPDWKPQPIFSWDPYVRLTVVGVVVMQSLWTICTAGGDQTVIQRFMATKDVAAARRSYLVNSLVGVVVLVVLTLVGFSLMGYFRSFPEHLPAGHTVNSGADDLFPHFIANLLPIGVSGLVVSGMFAAAMSSVDSGVNSISAVVLTDFVDRFRDEPMARQTHVRAAQMIVVIVGAIVIGGSTLIEYVPGNLMVVSKRVTGLLVTPIFTLFFMALFVRFATAAGTNAGAACGFLTALLVSFWNPLVEDRSLSITWINPTALLVGITVGCIVSALFPLKPADDAKYS